MAILAPLGVSQDLPLTAFAPGLLFRYHQMFQFTAPSSAAMRFGIIIGGIHTLQEDTVSYPSMLVCRRLMISEAVITSGAVT